MSGGEFSHQQHYINYIAESIQEIIDRNGKPKTAEELKEEGWQGTYWYEKYPEGLCHHKYNDDVIDRMKRGVLQLKMAYIYAQRIDWLLSGDDGEESFIERLKEDINKLGE